MGVLEELGDAAPVAPLTGGVLGELGSLSNTIQMEANGKKKRVPANLKSHYENLGFLPLVGGAVGGFAGGGALTKGAAGAVNKLTGKKIVPNWNPVAAGGAGLGAWGGEGVRQIAATTMGAFGGEAGVPETTDDLLLAQGKAGAAAAIGELGGQQLVRGLGWVGNKAGQSALKAPIEVVRTAIGEGIAASAGGLAKAGRQIGKLAGHAREIAAAATQGGVKLDLKFGVADPVLDAFEKEIIGSGFKVQERLATLHKVIGTVMDDNPAPVSPLKALLFRQTADKAIKALRKAEAAGHVGPAEMEELQIWRAITDRTRDFMNNLPATYKSRTGQTMADINARNSALIAVEEAVNRVTKPGRGIGERIGGTLVARGSMAAAGGAWGAFGGEGKLPGGFIQRMTEGAALGGLAGNPWLLQQAARAGSSRVIRRGVPTTLQIGAQGLMPAKREKP